MDERQQRIISIANALLASDGCDKDGASTGEQIAGAILAGHPEWAGFTDSDGYTDVIGMIDRLGHDWFELVRDTRQWVEFSTP